jgi:hypothetical protein
MTTSDEPSQYDSTNNTSSKTNYKNYRNNYSSYSNKSFRFRYVIGGLIVSAISSIALNHIIPYYSSKHNYRADMDANHDLGIAIKPGSVTAFVLTWNPCGEGIGHAAILLVSQSGSQYISFWPKNESVLENVKKLALSSPGRLCSINDDIGQEGGRLPTTIHQIDGLDENEINRFVAKFKSRLEKGKITFSLCHNLHYQLSFFSDKKSSYNCTGLVDEILHIGGFTKPIYTAPYGRAPLSSDILECKGASLVDNKELSERVLLTAGFDEEMAVKSLADNQKIDEQSAREIITNQSAGSHTPECPSI